jgi:Fe-S-cluster containining protein
MRCDTGCGECCGPVPVTAAELNRVRVHAAAKGVTPKKQGIACPFYQEGQCAVHEVRPLLCRTFGHVPRMTCPRGYNVNISSNRERQLFSGYKAEHMLHELLLPLYPEMTLKDILGEAS